MTEKSDSQFDNIPSDPGSGRIEPVVRPWWQILLVGFAAGGGGTLIGVGGGIIMVPIMVLWGITQKKAQGTSLVVITALVPVAIAVYYLLNDSNIDFHFAVPLAIGGVFGSILGSWLALRFSNRLLGRFFGAFLILIALRLIFMPSIGEQNTVTEFTGCLEYIETVLFGGLAGMVAGFFGVGGGVVFVPTGVLLGGLTQGCAQGSSFAAMLPTVLVGSINYIRKREIEWTFVRFMIPGAWLGAIFGSWAATALAEIYNGRILTVLFACFLAYVGTRNLLLIDSRDEK